MIRRLALLAALAPAPALAVTDATEPPVQTDTTITCTGGQVWDHDKGACVNPEEARLGDDALYGAARELAYHGRAEDALRVLDAMAAQDGDRVLTYRGFLARKAGRLDEGLAHYRAALARNPGNLLARSYMGQGFAEAGNLPAARAELAAIRARGGAGTRAEAALAEAIRSGRGSSY